MTRFKYKSWADISCQKWMVSICHSGHGVDFKVLVRSNWWSLFDGSPICEWWFSIIKPFVAELPHVPTIKVCHSLCNFCPRNSSVEVQHLCSNLLHEFGCWLYRHQLTIKFVSASDYFNVIQVVALDCWKGYSTVVHLSCKNFVSVEPISKNTTVTVWTVETFLSSNIREAVNEGVHRVVLLRNIIQVTGDFINSKVAIDSLQKKERIKIRVFPAWSIIKHTDRRIYHLIITYHEKAWVENRLF